MSGVSIEAPVLLYAVLPDGPEALPVPPGARGAHDVLDGMPLGVYTGLRTYEGERLLGLEAHLDRTDRCLELSGWSIRLDRDAVRRALAHILGEHPFGEAFVRLDVLAEAPGAGYPDARTLISVSRLAAVPASFLAEGVQLEIARGLERRRPRIKQAEFVIQRRPYPLNQRDVFDHLLVDAEDRILEGTSSNFYAILAGELRTARERMLEGITRRYVLDLCAAQSLPVRLEPIRLSELTTVAEAFLTSSTRGVVPVVGVADVSIGDGLPGPRSRSLGEAFDALAVRAARPAWPPPGPVDG